MSATPAEASRTALPGPGAQAVAAGPFCALAGVWIAGILAGRVWGSAALWLVLAMVSGAVMVIMWMRGRRRGVGAWGLVVAACVSACWFVVSTRYVRGEPVGRFALDEPQLARVTGLVDGPARLSAPQRGAFAKFSYQSPVTLFTLSVDSIAVDGQSRSASGRLLVKVQQADHRLRGGERIEATGWLAAIEGPFNPGEPDFRVIMAQRGIVGRLSLATRGNWRLLRDARPASAWARFRRAVSDAAEASLQLGMQGDESHLAFLEQILLGRRTRESGDLEESFRRVGLAHLLSISGAHLAILLGLVWLLVRLAAPSPRVAAWIVLAVLAMYLLAVPARVPIVRAGIMAGLLGAGFAWGRRVGGVELIALAALVVLIWLPGDLFNAGFQLSFGVVAALLMFAQVASQRLWPDPMGAPAPLDQAGPMRHRPFARWFFDYLAVSLVAFCVAMPLVAYHFQIISPLAVLLSVMALPVVTAVLALGYLKILAGLAWPTVGVMLAGPTRWVSGAMTGLVAEASRWPGAAVELTRPPSVFWVGATLALVVAILSGWFARRRLAMAAAVAACVVWPMLPNNDDVFAADPPARASGPALRVNMFAVGDGSCYLLRVYRPEDLEARPRTLMFDCGSQAYLDVGRRSIGPALKRMGVTRIDVMMLSHADMDHFCGALDVVDQVRVDRVLVSPQLLDEARASPDQTAAFLVDGLRGRGALAEPVSKGWRLAWPGAELELLWPPADFIAQRANDTSLVLSVRTPASRLLFNGDIQQDAITALLDAQTDLRADACDLPHHGSFVDASPRWLDAVGPKVVLQSSGPARLRRDRWADLLRQRNIQRLVTDRDGMVDLTLYRDGAIEWRTFRAAKNGTD